MPFQGLLTLWAVWNDRLFQAAIGKNAYIIVSFFLAFPHN